MDLLNHFLFTIHSLPSGGKKQKHKQKKKHMEWLPVSKSPSTVVQRFQRKDKPEKNVAALKQASTVKHLIIIARCAGVMKLKHLTWKSCNIPALAIYKRIKKSFNVYTNDQMVKG